MKRPKTDFKRGLSKTELTIYKSLRILLWILLALILIFNAADALHSLIVKVALLMALVAVLVLLILVMLLSNWVRDNRRGYSINSSGNGDSGGVYYREGKKQLMITFNRFPFVIYLPSEEVWNRDAPDWAKNRRAEIIGRIQQNYKSAQYEESGGVYDYSLDKSNAAELNALLESKKLEERSGKIEGEVTRHFNGG